MDPAHARRLERVYHEANCNAYYAPRATVGDGEATVVIPVSEKLYHAAGAVHGNVLFKALDDSAFFAANSLVPDVFVTTAGLHVEFLRPVTQGHITGKGRVVHRGSRRIVAESVATDDDGNELARGLGTFMPTRAPLPE